MTTSIRWSNALSSRVSCKAAFCLLGRDRIFTVVGRIPHPNTVFTRNDLLEFVGSQDRLVLRRRVFSSTSRKTSNSLCRAPQMATEGMLRLRSVRDDTDDPMVSTEKPGEPVSDASISDFRGGVVALGKFDALHTGHRALAEQAANMGVPILLSFSGMSDVLGWVPRLPVAAFCDRKRIMAIWARNCGGVVPLEYSLEFSKVRTLSPREFVQKLSHDLHVKGVVAGANYRFGYKAAGDASDLVHLCNEYGLESFIVQPVMDDKEGSSGMNGELSGSSREKGQISSTRVRKALAMGNMERVATLLGRKHRLVLKLDNYTKESGKLVIPVRSALNQYPQEGLYTCGVIGTGDYISEVVGVPVHDKHLDDHLIRASQVKIGPAWIEIPLADADIELVLQRKLLGLEFSS